MFNELAQRQVAFDGLVRLRFPARVAAGKSAWRI